MGDIERAGAHRDGLEFSVSEAAREKATARLRSQEIQAFLSKAADTARELGAASFTLLKLSTHGDVRPVPVLQRGVMTLSSAETAPSFNPGKSRLGITVSNEILLPEKVYPGH